MKRKELVKEISNDIGVDADVVNAVLLSMFDSIRANLSKGETIFLRGFGTFYSRLENERLGRNISKGTSVVIPARVVPKLKFVNSFLEQVKKGGNKNGF